MRVGGEKEGKCSRGDSGKALVIVVAQADGGRDWENSTSACARCIHKQLGGGYNRKCKTRKCCLNRWIEWVQTAKYDRLCPRNSP